MEKSRTCSTTVKKSTSGNNSNSLKKNQANKKKKKSKKTAKDGGKSSISPDAIGNISDNAGDSDAVNFDSYNSLDVAGKPSTLLKSSAVHTKSAANIVCTPLKLAKAHKAFVNISAASRSNTTPTTDSNTARPSKTVSKPWTDQSGPHQESLRWEKCLSDSEAEDDRIRAYKLNRRKRYIAASNMTYSEWLSASSSSTSVQSCESAEWN